MPSLILRCTIYASLLLFSTINGECSGCDVTRGGCPGCACFLNEDVTGNCQPLCTPCAPCEPEMEVPPTCQIYEQCPFGCDSIDRGGLSCDCTGETTTCPGNEPVGPTDGLFFCKRCKNNLVLSNSECCPNTCENPTASQLCRCAEGTYCTCPDGLLYDSTTESCVPQNQCRTPTPSCGDCETTTYDGCNECDCTDPTRPVCTEIGCPKDQIFTDGRRCLDPNTECSINCLEYNNGCQTCSCRDRGAFCNQLVCVTLGPRKCLECEGNTVKQDCPRRGRFANCDERDTCEDDEIICDCDRTNERFDPSQGICVRRNECS